jgi:uncharacterized protein (DUF1697 family)
MQPLSAVIPQQPAGNNDMHIIRYVAMLRGINVGGNNIIRMDELKKLFGETGFADVTAYIQSGNVIFSSCEADKAHVAMKIEESLCVKLNCKTNLALLTAAEMNEIIDGKPEGFGENMSEYRHDVIYPISPLTAGDVIKEIKTRDGVDKVYEGRHAVYISRLASELGKSHFRSIVETPIYRNITVRNWNTTVKLCKLANLSSIQGSEQR